jgi:2-polyprenyl-3-methyl-5-hydroxy-6-metoxy-1,4-benzoquinol methylase
MATPDTTPDMAQRDAFVGRLFEATIGAVDLCSIYLGDRLGYYQLLGDGRALTSEELATETGTAERYAREWLEQQAVTGIVEVAEAGNSATRRYRLPAGHAEVLTATESLNYLAPMARLMVGTATTLPAVAAAYRTGDGVPFAAYGDDIRDGIADNNRPLFLNLLGQEWLPAIPALHARLLAAPPARVADIGCGSGWSSIAIAQAYPLVHVDGLDLDAASIASASANAAAAGLADRVTFAVRDAADPAFAGRYDLAVAIDCLHDMAKPVEALIAMRHLVAPDGVVLIIDKRVADTFMPDGDAMERIMFGFSVTHCLPVAMVEQPSAATGTAMRRSTLHRYAAEAGFGQVTDLPIAHDALRFYLLTP